MSFRMEIETDNAAFTEEGADGLGEVARILRLVADAIEAGQLTGSPRDINGNKVGSYHMIID